RPRGRGPGTSAPKAERRIEPGRRNPTTIGFRPVTKIILFDIDGTLVLTGGAGVRAMTLAFEELFAIPDAFQGIPMPGRTDAGILYDAVTAHGVGARELARFRSAYLAHLAREVEKPGPRKGIMPGVR